jgi:hypothetical protein
VCCEVATISKEVISRPMHTVREESGMDLEVMLAAWYPAPSYDWNREAPTFCSDRSIRGAGRVTALTGLHRYYLQDSERHSILSAERWASKQPNARSARMLTLARPSDRQTDAITWWQADLHLSILERLTSC